MDPTFPLVPIANFLACILVALPLSRNIFRTGNVGVYMFAIWVGIVSFYSAVNSIIWKDNVENKAPIWCDITAHLDVGSETAISACSVAISRYLYRITRLREVVQDKRQKTKNLVIDLLLCVGLPVSFMVLAYIAQVARYQILEELGCVNASDLDGLTLMLLFIWPTILPLITLTFYTPRILWTLYKQRKEVNEFLSSSDSSINRGTYYRLMVLGAMDVLLTLPLNVIGLAQDLTQEHLVFWPGWDALHADFSRIPTASAEVWKSLGFWAQFNVKWDEWINPLLALIFFALFGLTEEARGRYAAVFWTSAKPFGLRPNPKANKEQSNVIFASGVFGPSTSSSSTSQDTFNSEPSSPFEVSTTLEKQDRLDIENMSINSAGLGGFPNDQKEAMAVKEVSESIAPSTHSASI